MPSGVGALRKYDAGKFGQKQVENALLGGLPLPPRRVPYKTGTGPLREYGKKLRPLPGPKAQKPFSPGTSPLASNAYTPPVLQKVTRKKKIKPSAASAGKGKGKVKPSAGKGKGKVKPSKGYGEKASTDSLGAFSDFRYGRNPDYAPGVKGGRRRQGKGTPKIAPSKKAGGGGKGISPIAAGIIGFGAGLLGGGLLGRGKRGNISGSYNRNVSNTYNYYIPRGRVRGY